MRKKLLSALLTLALLVTLLPLSAASSTVGDLPPFDEAKSHEVDAMLLKGNYKEPDNYDPTETDEDREDYVSNHPFDKTALYQYFADTDQTVYEIGFGTHRTGAGEDIISVNDVWVTVGGTEVKAEKTPYMADNMFHFRFAIAGKPQQEVPLKLHWWPSRDNPDYAYRNVFLKLAELVEEPGAGEDPGTGTQPGTGEAPGTGEQPGTGGQTDPSVVPDGVYERHVDLWNYYEDRPSMGNQAILSPAKITVTGGRAKMELSVKPITFMSMFGGVTDLFILDGQYKYNDKSNRTAAVGSDAAKFGEKQKEYFQKFTFDVSPDVVKATDKTPISVVVWVDAMDSLNGTGQRGSGEQPAKLRIYPEGQKPEVREEDQIPNLPDAAPPVDVPELVNPKTAQGMVERFTEPGAPSMANSTMDHTVRYQELDGKTRYEVTFKEYKDAEYNSGKSDISAARLWFWDGDVAKEAKLVKTVGKDNTFRFEVAGGLKDKISIALWIVPMQKVLGDGAAVQKATLLLSTAGEMEGTMVDTRYEIIPYTVVMTEDASLSADAVVVDQAGKDGLKRVNRTYKAINGVSTGELLGTDAEVLKEAVNKEVRVGSLATYQANKKQFEEKANVPAADGSKSYPARLVVPDKQEVDMYVSPYFEPSVQVKTEAGQTTYKLHFKPLSPFAPSVKRVYLVVDGQEVPTTALGTETKTGGNGETWKQNKDKSTDFSFNLPGDVQTEVLLHIEYQEKKPGALLKLDTTKESIISWEPAKSTVEKIAFATTYVDAPDLDRGVEQVQTEGVDGERVKTEFIRTLNGRPTGEASSEVLVATAKPAVDKVIRRGTRAAGGTDLIVPAKDLSVVTPAEWTLNGPGQTFVMKVNSDLANLVEVSVDGKQLTSDQYTAESGSTVITLKPAYLNSLPAGSHSLLARFKAGGQFAAGDVMHIFTVKAASSTPGSETATTTTASVPSTTATSATAVTPGATTTTAAQPSGSKSGQQPGQQATKPTDQSKGAQLARTGERNIAIAGVVCLLAAGVITVIVRGRKNHLHD